MKVLPLRSLLQLLNRAPRSIKKRVEPFCFVLFSFLLFSSILGCTPSQPNICIKDERVYCVTSDWIPVITWDACYRRGLSCMEGGCWDYALYEFEQALYLKSKDSKNVRAYGMHFRDDYFPHREMGISYFHLGRLEDALSELELSISQTPSARAKYYLNQTRRAYLIATGKDTGSPSIHIDLPEGVYITDGDGKDSSINEGYLTNHTPFEIEGVARDDKFVASILVNQHPVFIELAEAFIPFSVSVDLHEGLNTVEVIATDLIGRVEKKNIRIFLDQQGPLVIANPLNEDQLRDSIEVRITALLYDRTGVTSFKLSGRQVPLIGLEKLCMIEEDIPLYKGLKAVNFTAQDLAGNITKGEIPLVAGSVRRKAALRMACSNGGDCPVYMAQAVDSSHILFDIITPPGDELVTYYSDIFLEGEIEATKGIRRIALNDQDLTNVDEIERFRSEHRDALIERIKRDNINPENFIDKMNRLLKRNTSYYLNQKIPIRDPSTTLTLKAVDNSGFSKVQEFHIIRIPRQEVFKSQERMLVAVLPFDIEINTSYNREHQEYILDTFTEVLAQQGRFNLLEREKLPLELIKKAEKAGNMCSENLAQQIAALTSAEGIICGNIEKWMDGIEINAAFREPVKGNDLIFHDVFSPSDTTKDLKQMVSGLAIKFRDSFPVCLGIVERFKGNTIQVDIGSEKGIFPGMSFNVFTDEIDLISKARINRVELKSSEALLEERIKDEDMKEGLRVRTR